jgi:hypothetical protein
MKNIAGTNGGIYLSKIEAETGISRDSKNQFL